jgi:ABC-type proline/glycine betaine transport system ATPase subunit
MHTAQHLVSNCLSGDLAHGRTIILVTHHVALCLPIAHYLLELEKGKIKHQGTIPELDERGLLLKVVESEEEPFLETQLSDQETLNEADSVAVEHHHPRPHRQPDDGKLIEVEARAEGRVSLRSYFTYIRAAGVYCWFLTLAVMTLIRAINIGNQVSHPISSRDLLLMKLDHRFSWLDGVKPMRKSTQC